MNINSNFSIPHSYLTALPIAVHLSTRDELYLVAVAEYYLCGRLITHTTPRPLVSSKSFVKNFVLSPLKSVKVCGLF